MNFDGNLNNSFDDDIELTSETDQGGIIIPKKTCEHVQYVHLIKNIPFIANHQCIDCENSNENWLCLSCGDIHCSRYVNNHGEEHWLFTLLTDGDESIGHCLTSSLEDLSIWCYLCKSYIKNSRLTYLIENLERKKFGSNEQIDEQMSSTTTISDSSISRKSTDNPSTILAIQDLTLLNELKNADLLPHCYTIKLRSASIDELTSLHSSDYVNMIVSAEKSHQDIVDHRFQLQYNETTFTNARISAGITIDVIENVLEKHINGFILSTSPGHRAFRNHGNGTSIYNNIALAIHSVLKFKENVDERRPSLALIDSNNHLHMEGATPFEDAICHIINTLTPSPKPLDRSNNLQKNPIESNQKNFQIERVMIIDLTSEHGCGIQSIYYETNQVFYLSIHPEDHQHKSSYHECGKNHGLGYTMNIPLKSLDQITDYDYLKIMNELILPLCKTYQPELIILCVDFHFEQISSLCYAWIVEQLNVIDNSKLVVTFDGNLSSISSKTAYVQMIISILIGELSVRNYSQWNLDHTIDLDVQEKIHLIRTKYKQYWSCFQ